LFFSRYIVDRPSITIESTPSMERDQPSVLSGNSDKNWRPQTWFQRVLDWQIMCYLLAESFDSRLTKHEFLRGLLPHYGVQCANEQRCHTAGGVDRRIPSTAQQACKRDAESCPVFPCVSKFQYSSQSGCHLRKCVLGAFSWSKVRRRKQGRIGLDPKGYEVG
jgi:hypothetical protein